MGCFDALSRCSWLGSDCEIKLTGPPARAASPGDARMSPAARSRCLAAPPVERTRVPAEGATRSKSPRPFQPRYGGECARAASRHVERTHARAERPVPSGWVGRRPWFVPRPAGRRCGDVRVPAPPDRMEPFGARTAVHLCAGGRLVSHQITGRCQLIKSCCSLVRALGPAG